MGSGEWSFPQLVGPSGISGLGRWQAVRSGAPSWRFNPLIWVPVQRLKGRVQVLPCHCSPWLLYPGWSFQSQKHPGTIMAQSQGVHWRAPFSPRTKRLSSIGYGGKGPRRLCTPPPLLDPDMLLALLSFEDIS